MAQTVISKAKELIKEVGKEEAKKLFQKRLKEVKNSKSFDDVCTASVLETAIEFIDRHNFISCNGQE